MGMGCLCQSANLLAMTGAKRPRQVIKTAAADSELEEGEVPAQEGEVRPEPGNVQMPGWPQVRTAEQTRLMLSKGLQLQQLHDQAICSSLACHNHVDHFCAVKASPCHMDPMPVVFATMLQLIPNEASGSSSTRDHWLHPSIVREYLACHAEAPPGAATSA